MALFSVLVSYIRNAILIFTQTPHISRAIYSLYRISPQTEDKTIVKQNKHNYKLAHHTRTHTQTHTHSLWIWSCCQRRLWERIENCIFCLYLLFCCCCCCCCKIKFNCHKQKSSASRMNVLIMIHGTRLALCIYKDIKKRRKAPR